jgi:hypothetical protein
MISTDGDDKPTKSVFDITGYGSDTFVEPKTEKKKAETKKPADNRPAALAEYATPQRRVALLTRPYEPTEFDQNTMIFRGPAYFDVETRTLKYQTIGLDPRPEWTPKVANDNHPRKHTSPALNEARNNTLMKGRSAADKILRNEWAFDILIEIHDLLDAAAPHSSWLQHNGHGAADELGPDDTNSGFGMDVIHDYGPAEDKIKKLWEYDYDLPKDQEQSRSKDGEPWNLGTVGELKDVLSEPSNTTVKALSSVGALENNHRNHVTHFRNRNGKPLKIQTRTRQAKGTRNVSDPADTKMYDGAALPRNRRGELTVGFFGGKIASSAGPAHSANDPWAAQIAAERARDDATIKLAECRLLVGDRPYEALTQAASGFRISELCGGRLNNTTDSARGRNLLQIAIERIIDARTASKMAA